MCWGFMEIPWPHDGRSTLPKETRKTLAPTHMATNALLRICQMMKTVLGQSRHRAFLGSSVCARPAARGGSIPFETERLGFTSIANDLNPVAALILKATAEWPAKHGTRVIEQFKELGKEFIGRAEPKYEHVPAEPEGVQITGYLWARTITCPYCDGLVPLSPNWRLAPDGTGVRLKPELGSGLGSDGRICSFEIVQSAEQSDGTVARGDGTCPYSDCGRVIDGDEIKRQAQAGQMGEQLFAVVYKDRVEKRLKSGKRGKDKWVRGYRSPRPEDDNSTEIKARLDEKLPEWEALDIVPTETIPDGNKTTEPNAME